MPTSTQFARARKALKCRWPFIGRWIQFRAIELLDGLRDDPGSIPLLCEALISDTPEVSARARRALGEVRSEGSIDALCELSLREPRGQAAQICLERRLVPSDAERACLFLFVTRQLDRYFEEDFDFQSLRLEYDRAEPRVKGLVLDVVRSGDARCLGFLGSRKRLSECTDREISLALQSFHRHGEWSRLFDAFLELPLKYGLSILRELRRASWLPVEPASRGVLLQALEDARGHVFPQPWKATQLPGTLRRALDSGREKPCSILSESELLERLESASPIESVAITQALALLPAVSISTHDRICESPHWLVRLAGRRLGFLADPCQDSASDPVQLVQAHSPPFPLLELWPHRAAPAHLERLASAGAEAWKGNLGAARRIFRAIVAHRITTGSFEELIVEPEDFAGTFELVDAPDLDAGAHAIDGAMP